MLEQSLKAWWKWRVKMKVKTTSFAKLRVRFNFSKMTIFGSILVSFWRKMNFKMRSRWVKNGPKMATMNDFNADLSILTSDYLGPELIMEISERNVSGCHPDFQSFLLLFFYMAYLVSLSWIIYIVQPCIFVFLQFENQPCSPDLLYLSFPAFLWSLLLKLGH